jgi:hypothetical protein
LVVKRETWSECDLTAPGYGFDKKIRVQLESKVDIKEWGLDSPDDADALALTFARKLVPKPDNRPLATWILPAGTGTGMDGIMDVTGCSDHASKCEADQAAQSAKRGAS